MAYTTPNISVRLAATQNVNVTALPTTIDGVTFDSAHDVVLLCHQNDPAENGIYGLVGSAFGRYVFPADETYDYRTYLVFPGTIVAVREGFTNGGSIWVCRNSPLETGFPNTLPIRFTNTEADLWRGANPNDPDAVTRTLQRASGYAAELQ